MNDAAATAEASRGTNSEGSLAAGFARGLMDLAVAKGADAAELLRRSGLDADALSDPDGRVSLARYKALMRAGQELSGDPALALHFGESVVITELSIVGLMGQACETVADAFALLGRFTRLAVDVELEEEANGQRIVMKRIGDALWLIDMRKNPNDFHEITESSFARMLSSAKLLSTRPFIKAVHVTHKAPAYRGEYERIFGVPVTFESDRNALQMTDDDWMALKTPLPSRYVFEILKQRAEALLEELDSDATVRGRVERLLAPVLHKGEAGMATIAARMGLSRPTLFRRLKAEGTNFEQVLDGLRRRLAVDYLKERHLSVNETAYLVGFSDPASFSRAFKRWTGSSPRAARSQG
jgi:AraC-like DNA-binding protein